MQNQIITISNKHKAAAQLIYDRIKDDISPKYIVTVTGEVGTGKSTVCYLLGRLLKEQGLKVKIMELDNYYKIPPLERKEWRRKHGIDAVGSDEYDWEKIYQTIQDFKNNKIATVPYVDLFTDYVDKLTTDFNGIDVLIIKGLYSIKCKESKYKVFIELSYEEAKSKNHFVENEEVDDFRLQIIHKEREEVKKLKEGVDYFVDFDFDAENYHL
jgi:uridine kinase